MSTMEWATVVGPKAKKEKLKVAPPIEERGSCEVKAPAPAVTTITTY